MESRPEYQQEDDVLQFADASSARNCGNLHIVRMTTPADFSTMSSLAHDTVSGSLDQIEASPIQKDPSISTANTQNSAHAVDQDDIHAESLENRQGSPVQDPVQDDATASATTNDDATSLHQAIEKYDLMTLNRLLNQRVDTESSNEHGEKPLYFACKIGFDEAVWPLLDAGADVESVSHGSLTPTTALHLTVERHWLQVTELLLLHGANVDAFSHDGMTPLLMAIKNRHLAMIRLLLRYGAKRSLGNVQGDTPLSLAQGAQDILALLEMSQGPPTTMIKLHEPRSTVMTTVRPPTDNRDKMIACHNFQAAVVEFHISDFEERKTEVMSVYELLYGQTSTAKPIERTGNEHSVFRWYHLPANNMEWVEDLVKRFVIESSESPQNISSDFMAVSGIKGRHDRRETTSNKLLSFMRPTCRPIPISPVGGSKGFKQIVAFAPYLHFEDQSKFAAGADELRKILSSSKPLKSILKKKNLRQKRDPGNPALWKAETPEALHVHLLKGYLTPKTKNDAPPLQTRRTLDQYFYTHLDTSDRDNDQVVFRWMSNPKNASISEAPKMFMVDQLWLWVINEDTVITCASEDMGSFSTPKSPEGPERSAHVHDAGYRPPEPVYRAQETGAPSIRIRTINRSRNRRARDWIHLTRPFLPAHASHYAQYRPPTEDEPAEFAAVDSGDNAVESDYSPLNVQQRVLRYLDKGDRAPIETPSQLASIITQLSMSVFDHHEIPADFQFFDFFEQSIGEVSNSAANLLKLFKLGAARADGDDVQEYLDIQDEADLLVEIEDIHDELMILQKVLDDQKLILREIGVTLMDSSSTSDDDELDNTSFPIGDHLIIENHLHRVESMLKSTDKTKNTLLSLLDLKQKQASIFQARASAGYSEQLARQAKQAEREGRTLMLFTVVTILFLPLSFMSAFFAIEIDAFPVDDNGKLQLNYVLKYMLGISAGLSIPFILIAFNQDRFGNWIDYARNWTRTWIRTHPFISMSLALLVTLGVLLSIVWTSSMAEGIKTAISVIAVLGCVVGFLGLGLYYMVHSIFGNMTTTSTSSDDTSPDS